MPLLITKIMVLPKLQSMSLLLLEIRNSKTGAETALLRLPSLFGLLPIMRLLLILLRLLQKMKL